MSKFLFQQSNWTPTATADASAIANGAHMTIKGGSTTQILKVQEVMVSGLAASVSSPTILQLARVSTLGITPTALAAPASDGPMHAATAALGAPPVTYTAAGTGPQRSVATSAARLMLNLNAYGGIVRWQAAPEAEWYIVGNAVTLGESTLSAFTGGTVGAVSAHLLYEPL